jgi:hypothetical protein
MPTQTSTPRLGLVLGRSLFPFTALTIIVGTLIWGPWISFVLAYAWWRLVARIG